MNYIFRHIIIVSFHCELDPEMSLIRLCMVNSIIETNKLIKLNCIWQTELKYKIGDHSACN